MIRVFCYLMIMGLLVSCGGQTYVGNDGYQGNTILDTIPWPAGWPREGFLKPGANHRYGFDISPNYPYVNGKIVTREDSTAYISFPIGETGYVTVFTDSGYGANDYTYYYCNPDNMGDLGLDYIDAETYREHEYKVDQLSKEKIALCRSGYENKQKIHELHTHGYKWKDDYNFYIYTFGKGGIINDGSFWPEFDGIYGQAIVKHGQLKTKQRDPIITELYQGDKLIGTTNRDYILSRARGDYKYKDCVKGEIDKFMDTVQYNSGIAGERRVVVQLDQPIRRFWPLKAGFGDKIELCGSNYNYENDPKNVRSLKLSVIFEKDENGRACRALNALVTWSNAENAWILTNEKGDQVASTSNVNPKCAIFLDTTDYYSVNYIEEITLGNAAETKVKGKAAVVILPYSTNTRTALHELGHSMGLTDVNDAYLSTSMTDNHKEGNLMHSSYTRKGLMLRNRGMVPEKEEERTDPNCRNYVSRNCVELQWDCLHKESNACLAPTLDPYLR